MKTLLLFVKFIGYQTCQMKKEDDSIIYSSSLIASYLKMYNINEYVLCVNIIEDIANTIDLIE